MAFVTITSGQTDANSPVDVALMDTIRTDLDNLDTRAVTLGDLHDHVGGDGNPIPFGGLANNAVGKGALNSTNGTISESIPGYSTQEIDAVLPGGNYAFMPQIKSSSATNLNFLGFSHNQARPPTGAFVPTSYTLMTGLFENVDSLAITAYMEQFYIQASPPYKVGDQEWGHFLYLLRSISTGEIKSAYEAEDPPYAYNGPSHNAKDSIERIMAVPHPFRSYFDKDPAADGLEIVLVDLREHDTKKWKNDNDKKGKGILEDLGHINKGGKIVTPQELGIGDIKGFTDKVKIRKA